MYQQLFTLNHSYIKNVYAKIRLFNNPNFFEVDKILIDYVERNNKKFEFYLLNHEFK